MKNQPDHLGPAGTCICPGCGFKEAKQPGVPCRDKSCPNCGRKLLREDGEHYQKVLAAKKQTDE